MKRFAVAFVAVVLAVGCDLFGPEEFGAIRGSTQLCSNTQIGLTCWITAGNDPPGNPITVTAAGPTSRTVLVTQSNPNPFLMADLPVGTYRINASYPPFVNSRGWDCRMWWDTMEAEVIANDTLTVTLKGSMVCED